MKNVIKIIGLGSLICFSFFYTDKVINVVNEQDPIMIELNNVFNRYKIDGVDGYIDNDTIVPGLRGKEIDIDKSYKEMREVGKYSEMLLVYKDVDINNKLIDNYDKYVIKGNSLKKQVSLVVIIDNINSFNLIKDIDYVSLNLFVDYNILSKNISSFKKNNFNIYNYGDNGLYTDSVVKYSNNLINNNYNSSLYCLAKYKDKDIIDVCSSNKMNTIFVDVISNNLYNYVRYNIKSGSIVLFNINNKNVSELKIVSDFINSKGLKIVSLEKLLKED